MSLTNSEERQYSLPDEIRDLVEGAAARPTSEILLEAADRLEAAEREQDKEKAEWRESIARAWKRTDAAESALAEAREAWAALTPHLPAEWDGGNLGYLVSDMDSALAIHPKEQRSAEEGDRADALAAAEQKIDLMRGWVEEQARGADQEHARALAAESALAERDKAIAEALEWLSPIRAPVPAEPGLRTSAAKARLILEDALAARPGEQK
jgi:hypothetical protein